MKLLTIFFLITAYLFGADMDYNNLQVSLITLGGVVFLGLIWMVVKYQNDVSRLKKELEEKEEKIQWLKQLEAQNEQKRVQNEHEREKEILELNSKIKELESKAKESSKNQVVAMIESQRDRRDKIIDRLSKKA
jgi:predicted Holliday junction resolvase-like endonuclease